jgi:hypothetical protein
MRLVIFSFCVIAFINSCSVGDGANGNAENYNTNKETVTHIANDPVNESADSDVRSAKKSEAFDRIGCWLGTNGGALIIEDARIKHLTSNKKSSYSYSVPEVVGDDNANGVLLEIKGVPNLEFIRPFTYLGYEGKDEMLGVDRILVRGYETMEGFSKKEFVTSEFFYREPCGE